jgi:hypothetical protein
VQLVRKLVVATFIVGAVLALAMSHSTQRRLVSIGYLGTVAPGQSVPVGGDGFAPNSSVTLTAESNPIFLKTVVADAGGKFSTDVTIPAGLSGSHNIVATGLDPSGQPHSQSSLVFVQAATTTAAAPSGPLPFTGMNTEMLVAVAAVALLLGTATVRGARRRVEERSRNQES